MVESNSTKTRILDSAEALFAESGFDGVSIRDIMHHANARLGILGYYFKSKEALLEAVVGRRNEDLNSRRRTRLALIAGTRESSVEKLVAILVEPYLELIAEQGQAWRSYAKLNAQLAQSPRWSGLIKKHFDDVVLLFIDEFARLYPTVPKSTVVRAFVIALGAMLSVLAMSGRMQSLSNGYVRDDELGPVMAHLSKFMAAGLRASFETTSGSTPSQADETPPESATASIDN